MFGREELKSNRFFGKIISALLVIILILIPTGVNAQDVKPPRPDNWPKPMNYFGLLVPTNQDYLPEEENLSEEDAGGMNLQNSISDWSKIAYQTYSLENWNILLTDANHSFTTMVTTTSSQEVTPRLNRGVTKVVFASNAYTDYEILTKDLTSGALANLTNNSGNDYTPEWSPDSSKIVFVGMSSSTNPDIYVVNSNGTNLTRLTNSLVEMDYFPTWSPDGSKIMWVKADEYGLGAIWMMNADGSNKVAFSNQIWYMQHPIWSKDGSRIAFDADLDGDGWNELAVVNSDGTNFQMILDLNTALTEPWAGSWSPDGTLIFFTRVHYIEDNGNLYLSTVDVKYKGISGTSFSSFTSTGYDMNPDYKVTDLLPPVTSILPLTPESPAADFSISCLGNDQGAAGIASYDFQYRILPITTWTDLSRSTSASIKFSPTLTTSACFRCRAIDKAYNIESWPVNGTEETCTSFYTWDITGKITDNRGAALANDSLEISPDPGGGILTDDRGNFSTRLVTEGMQTINVNSGLSEPYSAVIEDVDSPMNLNLYAVPGNSILQNGGFEEDFINPAGWQQSGSLEKRVNSEVVLTDHSAFEIGSTCTSASCIAPAEELGAGYYPSLVVDAFGQVHVIYFSTINSVAGIYYRFRDVSGIWSSPEFLASSNGAMTELKIDNHQTLHAAWSAPFLSFPSTNDLQYASKKIGEPWSQSEWVGGKGLPKMEIDEDGKVHLFAWADTIGLNYYVRSTQGVWSAPALIYNNFVSSFDTTRTDDGAIHVVYFQSLTGKYNHFSIRPEGGWTPLETIYSPTNTSYANLSISRAAENSIYFMAKDGIVSQGGGERFGVRDQYGSAMPLELLPYNWSAMVTDRVGVVHQFVSLDSNGYYLSRETNGTWETPSIFFQDSQFRGLQGDATIDVFDLPHFLMQKTNLTNELSLSYFHLQNAGSDEEGTISQTVTIPADMRNPTLALMVRAAKISPDSQSKLQAIVEDEGTFTSVLEVGEAEDWSLAWADLSPWIGKTITIHLTVHQSANDPWVKYYLDDISLGSWTTPWIEQVEPAALPEFDQDVITIHGENFSEPLNLFLNQIPIDQFSVINDQTIQFHLPAGIGPGVYDVSITTPIGQKTELHSGLRLGLAIYIPAILR